MAEIGGTDEALLAAIGECDRGALRELYDRPAPWLMLRLRRRGADGPLAEEIVQDTFLAVWRKPHSYSGTGPVAAWIWGIGVRRLIDRLRRSSSLQALPHGRGDVIVSPDDQVLLGVEFGDLDGALARLSPELRAVVQATVLDGLTTKEAAQLLGIPTGTVKTRMMRARAIEGGTRMSWHLQSDTLRSYASGSIDMTQQFSVEGAVRAVRLGRDPAGVP